MESVKNVKFVNKSPNVDPYYKYEGDSGFDLRAWIKKEDSNSVNSKGEPTITLRPLERRLIHTGLYFILPTYTELQVRPRSGMALNHGLSVVNTPGTVDNKYTGEVCVIAINLSNEVIEINNGDRIAQAVLCPVYCKELVTLENVDKIEDTERGQNGFGSTGTE